MTAVGPERPRAAASGVRATDIDGDQAADFSEVIRMSDALSSDYLEQYGVLPLRQHADRVIAATWLERVDPQALDDLALLFDARIELVRAPEHELRTAIRRVYGDEAVTAQQLIAGMTTEVR